MVFRRLFGKGGIPLEIDTIVPDEPVRPGGKVRGEVVVRAPERDLKIESIRMRMVVNASLTHKGDGDGTNDGATLCYPTASGWFEMKKGEERRIPFSERLRWETPPNELRGERLGVSIGIRTEVEAVGVKAATDLDPVRVETLPLHEAVLDAFAAEGYAFESSRVHENSIAPAEYHLYLWQGFRLVDRKGGEGRPPQLELVFHTNAVGSEIFLRRFRQSADGYWGDQPKALRFAAAHHEVGARDFDADARQWLEGLARLKHGKGEREDED
ncbi:sporulation protein [Streptomyces sp. R302]|uniref:sporulation protein n=1 Tax=unclassified Streptomyces TaxID=2593676 RepID=UPI00145EED13|nr:MULTISPECIES: sporulation protein [unclassified Streptomyces]NML49216.1 sporulation protein [Streptomyces sp. R301]NML77543.1 sporulation protein [Streptomyces sp. R302]